MNKLLTVLFLLSILAKGRGQQLHLEGFGAFSKTAYDQPYDAAKSYYAAGARLAAGTDHLQLGGEYRTHLTNPSFPAVFGEDEFDETYYGAFIRGKISRYPAMRFGVVLRAGAGSYNTTYRIKTPQGTSATYDYDPILGLNGGLGFSIPVIRVVMLELGYTYNYLKRPREESFPEYTASYHQLQAGLSFNFVFGKRAKHYQHLRDNWKWKDGWRG